MAKPHWATELVGDLPALLTVEEVMGTLRCSRRHLSRLTATGKLLGLRDKHAGNSRLLIPKKSLEEYLRGLEGLAA